MNTLQNVLVEEVSETVLLDITEISRREEMAEADICICRTWF